MISGVTQSDGNEVKQNQLHKMCGFFCLTRLGDNSVDGSIHVVCDRAELSA